MFLINKSIIAVLSFLSFFAASTRADNFYLGYGTHFAQGRTEAAPFNRVQVSDGLNTHRDEVYWSHVEVVRGVFSPNQNSQRSIDVFRAESQAGRHPLALLSYGNPHYDGGSQPSTASGRDGFASYASWVTSRLYPYGVKKYEIWNEWNIGAGTKPKVRFGDPRNYVDLVKHTRRAIKAVAVDAHVIVGALADDLPGWPWLQRTIGYGLLDYSDGISVHLYNHSVEESQAGVPEMIARLNSLNLLLDKAGRPSHPIYITEVGWPTVPKGGFSHESAASQAFAFAMEASLIPNVKGIWFYEMYDGGSDAYDREHNFGAYARNGMPKPLACSVRMSSELLLRSKPAGVIRRNESVIRQFTSGDFTYVVAYGLRSFSGREVSVNFGVVPRSVEHVDPLTCASSAISVANGRIELSSLGPVIFLKIHLGRDIKADFVR